MTPRFIEFLIVLILCLTAFLWVVGQLDEVRNELSGKVHGSVLYGSGSGLLYVDSHRDPSL